MSKIAFLFPGQGSQAVGMGKDLADQHPNVKSIFETADEKLNINLSGLIFDGPQDELTKTFNAQPALLTASIAMLEFFKQSGIHADYVAGHSLGEYTALVAAGTLSFGDAVQIVRKRGEFMEKAVPNGEGTMAAVLGIDRERLSELTAEITYEGYPVQLANMNCPGQIVISGSRKGVEMAGEKAKATGAKRVIGLEVSGPFHSELMKPASEELKSVLNQIDMHAATIPVISNVTAQPVTDAAEIKENLVKQLYSPVLWEDCVKTMLSLGVDTFIEIGPGKVLSGLVKKIDRAAKTYSVSDEASAFAVMEALKEELQ